MAEWFEKFFEGLYTRVLSKQFDEAKTLRHVRVVKRLLRARKGDRVLDIPCGMGRLTIPLARKGLAMTGVDLTKAFLRRARRRAGKEGLDIRFVQGDMREIAFDGEFDGAFNWFGSFGYFSDRDNLAFSRKALRALKPGGRFLVEGVNKSWLLAHFLKQSESLVAGVRIVHRNRWDARKQRVLSVWTLSKGRRTQRRRVSMRIYNGAEMRSLLRAAGFRDVKLYGYPPLGRLTRHSRRLIVVGTRPMK
jgi:ubiquinone/menaquinone biosynthesis C-methylase UbiE